MEGRENIQEPIAIIGFACRLPGGNTSPHKLWNFLERGGIASNKVPESRFNIGGHWDGSHKPRTMRPLGGMFLEDVDPADFDASFFEISRAEAISMDPNQRQMLEIVYEGLENAGIKLEGLDGAPVGCFVGSFASDYGDMQGRDPEDRPASITVGVGRAILANRISHFFNIKGPSMTLDTACSGSLVGLDVACRYLQSGEIEAAIIATSNLYLNPEHVMDLGAVGNAHSPSGLCHTFDISADGYVKAEAVSSVIIKRLSDAIRDKDPIRAVIRGTATNSDGRTPGIASPSAEAQAVAIRAAYARAGISDFNATTYLECHGTGTQAGDPIETSAAGAVFAETRPIDRPLIIGSIKSNVGHAEPAAGISGLIKAVMAIEHGVIPGNPTFENPNPKIEFEGWRLKASRTAIPWPDTSLRRASVNSFGYGGSNVHVVIEQASATDARKHTSSYISEDDDFMLGDEDSDRPFVLVLSANDSSSLQANIQALISHLINPQVQVSLPDLAYTLSERRTRLFHSAFVTTRNTELSDSDFVTGKRSTETPRIGFIFTGQGAQWPQMGKDLLEYFPLTRSILNELDRVLQNLPNPPQWSLVDELTQPRTSQHLRQPEFSQPLVTALQICIIQILKSWGIQPQGVVGHSSGEIAAAYSAGLLSQADAIKAAFYRGRAAVNSREDVEKDVGMLAVGLGSEAIRPFLDKFDSDAWIACYNSPKSLTVSGRLSALEGLKKELEAAGHFARLLQVDLAYHSSLMDKIGQEYLNLLSRDFKPSNGSDGVTMYSSVSGEKARVTDANYWQSNMVSPVLFDKALREMIQDTNGPNFLIEIGPSGALAGPVSQIKQSLLNQGANIAYHASWSRGANAGNSLYNVAGRLHMAGGSIDLAKVNQYELLDETPSTIVDLPNYVWNHSTKYWHENQASKDWRFKQYVHHDLLGSKVLGSSWKTPSWRKHLNLADVPWLKDHKMGSDVLMPGSGFITMALEAVYQQKRALDAGAYISGPNDLSYRFRNIRFEKALVLEEGKDATIMLTLTRVSGDKKWQEFTVSSTDGDVSIEHCTGLVRLQDAVNDTLDDDGFKPLESPTPARLWYKAQSEVGYGFGPDFQKLISVESTSGQRHGRALVSLREPDSKWNPQSYYPIHPASLDGCFQTVTPSLWAGDRSCLNAVVVPSMIDDIVINKVSASLGEGLSVANSEYSGRGRSEEAKSYIANCKVYDSKSGGLLMQMTGLHFAKLDTGVKPDPHIFQQIEWQPDISFLTQDQLSYLPEIDINKTIDLVSHKKPTLKVLEINLDESDDSTLWFTEEQMAVRAGYQEYCFASTDAKSLVKVQARHESSRNSSFFLINAAKEDLGFSALNSDLVIVKLGTRMPLDVDAVIAGARVHASKHGRILFVQSKSPGISLGLSDSGDLDQSPELPGTPGSSSESDSDSSSPDINTGSTSISTSPSRAKSQESPLSRLESGSLVLEPHTKSITRAEYLRDRLERLALKHADGSVLRINDAGGEVAFLCAFGHEEDTSATPGQLYVARLTNDSPELTPGLKRLLRASGWNIVEHRHQFFDIPSDGIILVLDELVGPVLTSTTDYQWEGLKQLVSSGRKLLWVTRGSQFQVTVPDNALVHGLFRVARMEDANAKLTTLDVQSSTSTATAVAIDQVLKHLRGQTAKTSLETEFAERDGIIYIHRVVPDNVVNDFKRAEREGADIITKSLHKSENRVSLRAERIGTFQSLTWCEETSSDTIIEAGKVEVEIYAVGVNFKDVAVTMGIVPENEYTLGYEAAGVVRRVGPGVNKFTTGDRVCFLNNGSYANRLHVSSERAHKIPDSMSFEDAATIPSVYLASLYSLFHVANMKRGQSVLIHSASGGVGISSIQLCQYMDAKIFVTVGSEEKRQFLIDNYNIPPSHIFSSRNVKFAKSILEATQGRGVDIIINSLTGEMLDETWRICADGGTMVEIGKKDIVDRNMLSMEPFDRNCSFRAMDFSYTKDISDPLIERLLGEIFVLVNAGHIHPVHPITTFGFNDVPSALTYIRSGRHIGKVVISKGSEKDVRVPIRPALPTLALQPDVSYLIVGGLKGLCGNLAIYMAQRGAKHIIVCSRSGIADEASQSIVANCVAHGCRVVEARGDIGESDFVRQLFSEAEPVIAGVVQGAMTLRDKPFETMTIEEYHTAIHAKTAGTWNLHRASLEQKRPLDFFTLLSSISGIVGKKGQSNYSAANTFLDAFASYRQSLGLRANAVDLGLIEDVGYVAEQGGMDSHFDKRQWTPILEGTLRKILGYSILQQTEPINVASSAQLVTGIGFPLPDDSDLIREARFGYHFARGASSGATAAESGSSEGTMRAFRMLQKSGAETAALVKEAVDILAAQFTKILRLDTEMESAKSLMAYGLDSLAAVELRNWVRSEFQGELTTLEITNASSLIALAEKLVGKLQSV